jgi:hypothetical protein
MGTAQNIAGQPLPHIAYAPRPDAEPDAEIATLATVYRFILSKSNASRQAVEPAPEPDGQNEAKEWKHG